ncbi:MAG TPA: hypothetical protein PLJ60_04060 [Chryseolinea sp.]|nr:hypothetical protein [Chryseolinea sp.]
MELRDLIVTPIIIILIYVIAYMVRARFADDVTRRYFIPALTVKLLGAIALGLLYQFYYDGGDTFVYHTHGSRVIWDAFVKSPSLGLKLLFSDGNLAPGMWESSEKIWHFYDQKSFFIIRIATIFDLLTFSSYSATAALFATLSFIGGWMMFLTFYKKYPEIHKALAYSCLFVPSIIFWGSGILKDTVTLAFLGIATYCIDRLFIERKPHLGFLILLIFSFYVIFSVKIYILMSFLIAAMFWIFSGSFFKIRSTILKLMLVPVIISFCLYVSYLGVKKLVEDDPLYSLERLAETVRVTAYDIRYWTGKNAGSGYTLGDLDGSINGILKLAPSAVNVSLFRPYLWEVRNPLMLFSAIESLLTLLFTLYVIRKTNFDFFKNLSSPETIFCLTFALIFAFGVGVSTYNFGTLARYKIPLLPYYFVSMVLILYHSKTKTDEEAEVIEP